PLLFVPCCTSFRSRSFDASAGFVRLTIRVVGVRLRANPTEGSFQGPKLQPTARSRAAIPTMSLGVGLEIATVIAKCKHIYTTFTNEYESAPARVQELVDTCRYLTNVLGDVEAVVGDGGVSRELHGTFERKLKECDGFIAKYRKLKSEFLDEERSAT